MTGRPNAIFFTDGYALIAKPGEMIETCRLHEDRYVRIDDGKQYPQLCANASHYGNTLIYHDKETLARNCNARLFKTRAKFDAAAARLADEFAE